jgi:hypothetical protein
MGERRGTGRQPATKFAHLRKKMEKNKLRKGSKEKHDPRQIGR